MTMWEFHNALRILRSIDEHELADVGALLAEDKHTKVNEWERFNADPFLYFITCDDDTAGKIWSIIQRRQPTGTRK